MKRDKLVFWITTGLLAGMMLFSAYNYFANPQLKAAFVHLGFPDYFRVQLAIAKVAGAALLLLPFVPGTLKEGAYWGFAFTFISAFIAHAAMHDALTNAIMPLVFLVVLAVSYVFYHRAKVPVAAS